MKNSIFLVIVFAFGTFTGCKSDSTTPSKAATFIGDTQPFGNDSIRSWVKTDDNGTPTSLGVTFKESALASLEKDSMMMTMLMLPSSGSGKAMPFDHIQVDWAPMGDPAPTFYNVPYLDIHCFNVSMNEMMAVKEGHDTFTVSSKYIPKDYMSMGDAEAQMGVHWFDSLSGEYHGTAFNHTLMYGFYHGDMYFVEPMVTKSDFDNKQNFSIDIKQPQFFKTSGYYPAKYSLTYDASAKTYSLSLDNLIKH